MLWLKLLADTKVYVRLVLHVCAATPCVDQKVPRSKVALGSQHFSLVDYLRLGRCAAGHWTASLRLLTFIPQFSRLLTFRDVIQTPTQLRLWTAWIR